MEERERQETVMRRKSRNREEREGNRDEKKEQETGRRGTGRKQ